MKIALVVVIVTLLAGCSPRPNATEWGEPVSGLRCKLMADKAKHSVGDKPIIKVMLGNCTDHDIFLRREHYYTVNIEQNGRDYANSTGWNANCDWEGDIVELSPGKAITYRVKQTDVLTKVAGRYEYIYHARYNSQEDNRLWRGLVSSRELCVTVR